MKIALIAFLAALSAVTEPELGKLLTYKDYPSAAMRENAQAAVYLEVELDASGQVTSCKKLGFIGSESLSDQVCPIIKGKTVPPARMPDGTASPARIRTIIRLALPGVPGADRIQRTEQPADIELTVAELPNSARVLDTNVVLGINSEGVPVACSPARFVKIKSLVGLACQNAMSAKYPRLLNVDGAPVAFVTTQKVRFSLGAEETAAP